MKYSVLPSVLRGFVAPARGCPVKFKKYDVKQYIKLSFSLGRVTAACTPFGPLVDVCSETDDYEKHEGNSVYVRINDLRELIGTLPKNEKMVDFRIESKLKKPRLSVSFGPPSRRNSYGRAIEIRMEAFLKGVFLEEIQEFDEEVPLFSARASLLKDCLASVRILNSKKSNHDKDYSRFGIQISGTKDRLRFIGVDGTRLVDVNIAADVEEEEILQDGFVMGVSVVDQLVPLLSFIDKEQMVTATVGRVGFKDFLVWSCVVEGVVFRVAEVLPKHQFPDVDSVLSAEKNNKYVLKRSALFDAVRRVLPLADTIGIFVPGSKDEEQVLKVGGIRDNRQFSQEDMDFQEVEQSSLYGFAFGMKAFYVTDSLQKISEDEIIVRGDDAVSSIFLEPVYKGEDDGIKKRFVLMPLQLNVSQ